MLPFAVREAAIDDAPAIARVHVDVWRTAYRDLLPASLLDGLSYEMREAFWAGAIREQRSPAAGIFVAEDSDGIVGFSSCGRERSGDPEFGGELYAIYVLESHAGRGIGRVLFNAVVERLERAGVRSMLLWVLSKNSSCGFYERMGGARVRTKTERFGDFETEEVAFGWRALPATGRG